MNQVSTATYLGVQQAATTNEVTLPPNLLPQLTRTLVIARIVALSPKALSYFLQSVLNAAIGVQALHLTHPLEMLQESTATVRSVDHPRPPTNITTRGSARGITTILWGQHRSPRPQRIHGSHRNRPAPPHALS